MIDVVVTDSWRIVVPCKFTRAVTGQAQADAPDVDDRGYLMGTLPGVWSAPVARGPIFGMLAEQTVRVKIVREDIDAGAPLFLVSSAPAIATVVLANGGPIPADGIMSVRGVARGTAKLEVHLGAADGPILAECLVRVHTQLRINVTPHFVRIDTAAATGAPPVLNLTPIMDHVQAIWNPCGITFNMLPAVPAENLTLQGNQLDTFVVQNPTFRPDLNSVLRLQRTRLGLRANQRDETLNLYVIQNFNNPAFNGTMLGIGISRQTAPTLGATDTGIIIAASGAAGAGGNDNMARLVAHEIGHFFRLQHVQRRNNDNPVLDTFGRRMLMHPFINLTGGTGGTALPRFNDVGYGAGSQGCLITMKNHINHTTDGECPTARDAIHSNNWF